MLGRADTTPSGLNRRSARGGRQGATLLVAVLTAAVFALSGCVSGARDSALNSATQNSATPDAHTTPSSVATPADCLTQLPVNAVDVNGTDVQLIGSADKAVVISNQSGNNLCRWVDLATTLHEHGYQVALYDYSTSASDNALEVLDYVRTHGPSTVGLLGGSQGAKASIVAAARAKSAPDALVALSGEQFLEGIDVQDFAAKLDCPTLYLTAANDPYGSTSANQNFQKATPAGLSTLKVVPGSDHGIQLLKDEGVEDEVIAFLDAHLTASAG